MAIYYKYYSYLPLEYFNKPTIKLSSPTHLNDPFESLLPSDINAYIDNFAQQEFMDQDIAKNIDKTSLVNSMKNIMKIHGVTSLSETQRNLLMWAHYADNHKGLCIGYDTDVIFREMDKVFLRDDGILRKIKYNNVRHEDFGHLQETINTKGLYEYLLYGLMLTKGDEWIYEKEFRYIISYHNASYLQIDGGEDNEYLQNDLQKMLTFDRLRKDDNYENRYLKANGKNVFSFGFLNKYKEASYFLYINPESIKKIYFGCRTDSKYIESIKELLSTEQHPLKSAKIEKFELSQKRFELYVPK